VPPLRPIAPFLVSRVPRITFGSGTIAGLPEAVAHHGRRVLLVSGRHPLRAAGRPLDVLAALAAAGLEAESWSVSGEPTPLLVDQAVAHFRERDIAVVVGIGGGSALDTAKAVAGLLRSGDSVLEHLEGVGAGRALDGPVAPWVAVPTTAGTGSEATRNAVVSVPGQGKRSFRDERLIAAEAILDPDLLADCPPAQIAASGLDALTQLLEAYVSLRASPLTDALALSGLRAICEALLPWFHAVRDEEPDSPAAVTGRTGMAYAALASGIALANAGLGATHGVAAALGGRFAIPHGVACGATLVATVRVNLRALEARDPAGVALPRYADVGRLLGGAPNLSDRDARARLVGLLESWSRELQVPGLRSFGVEGGRLAELVALSRGSSMRSNPIELSDDEIERILLESL
jgi:alcohol dehydrogenase class IV